MLIAVADLGAAGRRLRETYGLASVEGGRHHDWGTANRIVPLGDAYLELIAVVDDAVAQRGPFGRWIGAGPLPRPLGWAVRTSALDAVARRLGLAVHRGTRARADGGLVRWRLAGVGEASAEPSRPFFIEWARGTILPGRTAVAHPAGPVTLARLELVGDAASLGEWLGPHRLPVTIRPGPSAVSAVVLASPDGEFRVG